MGSDAGEARVDLDLGGNLVRRSAAVLALLERAGGLGRWDRGGVWVVHLRPSGGQRDQPALFERAALQRVSSDGPLMRWLALNLLVLLVGWMVVFAGLRRLIERKG
jgi:hypothetical protein